MTTVENRIESTMEEAMRCKTDDELRLVVTKNAAQYLPDAVALAKAELTRRGINEVSAPEVEASLTRAL